MFGLGWQELLIILVIVLAIFGTSRLAGLGGALGGSIREFKRSVRDEDPALPGTQVDTPEQVEKKVTTGINQS